MTTHDGGDAFRVRCLDVDLLIKSSSPEIAAAVRRAWSDAEVNTVGADALEVTVGFESGADVIRADVVGADVATVLHHLSPVVTRRVIEARAGDLLMLHAAALADPDSGATAVLIAPSGTGKTTASRALGRRFAYLSDETAGIELDGRVVPYRKPLSIIEGSWVKNQVAPSTLGLKRIDRDCHLAAVLLLKRSTDHTGLPLITRLRTVDAIGAIVPEASSLARMDQPLHRIATALNMTGGAYEVIYREAASLETVLVDRLANGS